MADRISQVLAMLDGMPPDAQAKLIDEIGARDPRLARRIRERHFGFDDLRHADPRGMQALVAELDRRIVLLALRGADDAVLAAVVHAHSTAAGQRLLADLDALGPQRRSDVETARAAVVRAALALRRAGTLRVDRPGVADPMV